MCCIRWLMHFSQGNIISLGTLVTNSCNFFAFWVSFSLSVDLVLHLLPKIKMFYVLFQIYQHLAPYSKLFKELKNDIEILVDQAVFKIWIKTVKMLFGSVTQELLGLPEVWWYFWVPQTIFYKPSVSCLKKMLIILR